MMWLSQILLPPGTFWINGYVRYISSRSRHFRFSKAIIHYKLGIWKIARLVREQGPQFIILHLDVKAVEDVRINVEEGEGSNILMPKVLLLWSWFHYNPLLRDSRFLELWVVPNLNVEHWICMKTKSCLWSKDIIFICLNFHECDISWGLVCTLCITNSSSGKPSFSFFVIAIEFNS